MNGTPSKVDGECKPKGVKDGTCGDRQSISCNDGVRLTDTLINGNTELVDVQPVQTTLQQEPQGVQVPQYSVVRWERFLPLRSLKVLLVENDDSTRHVVSALLRNCSYEVTAVENGLEAWSILEDLTNHIDLVITEMDMPYLTGIGLLSKIMNHKTCKNIPVIMTSCNDSMGIVFNCLSKGAVDFLVKPIRKNELKNLWQHVWRRCHSSSGSGSESGIRTQKSIKSTGNEESENNTDSNDEDDNISVGPLARDGSDNGSNTQSSWSKRATELDSPHPMSPWGQVGHPGDSTRALITNSRQDVPHDNQVLGTATGECQKTDDRLDLKAGAPGNLDLQLQGPSHKFMDTMTDMQNNVDFDLVSNKKRLEKCNEDLNDEAPEMKRNDPDADTVSLTPQMKLSCSDIPSHPSMINNQKGMAGYGTKEGPVLELSLKQLRDGRYTGTGVQGSNFLKLSLPSAFSRYDNSKAANPAPTGNVGSCSPVDDNSEAAKADSMHNFLTTSNTTPNGRSNGSSDNNDMGSTTNNIPTIPEATGDRSMAKSTINIRNGSAFHPVQNDDDSSLQPVSASQDAPEKQQIQVQHHHHHYHHYHHHHVRNLKQQQQLNHDGNAANYGSASGSNNGSGQNGSSEPNGSSNGVMDDETNVTMHNGEAAKGVASNSGISGGSGLNQHQMAQREIALNKFRQKRKERCFDKKVRYQSRKRLAEQRPRVHGQFVRQADKKLIMETEDADS